MKTTSILVGGEWREGGGAAYATRYPADDSVNAELRAASVQDVEQAVQAAEAAWRHPSWRGLKPHERASILFRISGLIRSQAEELAQLQRRDNGKPISETRALVASAAGTFQFYAAACETLEETLTPPRGDYLTMSV
ncbi:MAG TPA: aldehyde dehydrogenase family protein, partial [Burkholderiales bacterium]|nr:aldehyde dehydrogenase family protein [Burkholderiales bacterium]